ncbi:hypothetical protein [Arcticibacterium luteifluviistationis]|uniref:Uncharacterized protein n=1 Tax=Arcticibacterium luteifluviistationis TaxID=1784714 RepID=A0A2Z4G9G3_9BACT|nr:hypothetical protein [Arcticibacterium luteifluviistationis]AWV97725.1 hypothetical protein DJ013_05905 [Arcticibacterium luteifluviistationis]
MKTIRLFILLISLIISSCSKNKEDIKPTVLSDFEKETISYFKEIALGFEYGNNSEITRKWDTEMKIFVGGEKKDYLINELNTVVSEINALSTDGFYISVTTDSLLSNYYIFLGSGNDYGSKFPGSKDLINNNYGLFSINWNAENNLFKGRMYVDI